MVTHVCPSDVGSEWRSSEQRMVQPRKYQPHASQCAMMSQPVTVWMTWKTLAAENLAQRCISRLIRIRRITLRRRKAAQGPVMGSAEKGTDESRSTGNQEVR